MFKWLKRLRHIVDFYDADRFQLATALENRIKFLEALLIDQTTIAVDVGYKSPTHIIVMGRYKDRDLVEIFSLPSNDFFEIVNRLKDLKKRGRIDIIDAPIGMRTVLKREMED